MHDLISISDLSKNEVLSLLSEAAKMEKLIGKPQAQKILSGKIVANMFFEPSTRTNLSFQTAALRLGAGMLVFHSDKSSSAKGESFEDTIRMVDGYADAIVIRHPNEGFAKKAADAASHPVINAGDGGNQHPTQSLIDLYTIKKLKGDISNLHITLFGDLKYARAMRSLLYALSMFGAEITLASPESLRMDPLLVKEVEKKFGARIQQVARPSLANCDILYACRVQKERFSNPEEAVRMQSAFRVDAKLLSGAPKTMAILHPLPKLDEIPPEVDRDPRAKYFEQAKNGVPVRMAVLAQIISGSGAGGSSGAKRGV